VGAPLRSSFDPMDMAGLVGQQATGVVGAHPPATGPEAACHQKGNAAGSPGSARGSQHEDPTGPSTRANHADKPLVTFRMTEDALTRLEAGLRSQERRLLSRASPSAPASSDADAVLDEGSFSRARLPPMLPVLVRNELGARCQQNRRLPPAGQLPMVPGIRSVEMAFRQDREVQPKARRSNPAVRSCTFVVMMLIATIAGTSPTSESGNLEIVNPPTASQRDFEPTQVVVESEVVTSTVPPRARNSAAR